MQIKLFGKNLFEFHGRHGDLLAIPSMDALKKSKYLPDFYKDHQNWESPATLSDYVIVNTSTPGGMVAVPKGKDGEKPKEEQKKLTPKEVFDLKTLNDESFKLAVDDDYVDAQIAHFKQKLELISAEEYDMRRGVEQIGSILIRMENRKKYTKHVKFFEQFPYTTTQKLEAVLKDNNYLKCGQVAQFLADMPKDATEVMREYNAACKSLCDKQAVFYIVADKKDFERTNSRRDPILLGQSPFGHVWQILGAWDKEMLLLEDL